MSDANLIRLCKLPSDLGAAAGRELYLDPAGLTFLVGPAPGQADANGAAGGPESLTDFLAGHPDLREPVRAFVVGRMTGHPQAFQEERDEQLREMVARITPENRHDEIEWGPPVGREVW